MESSVSLTLRELLTLLAGSFVTGLVLSFDTQKFTSILQGLRLWLTSRRANGVSAGK